mmetsp:Transcript_14558/g.37666  ORF Transcript_14558/g.37666 Transcript_14558/m.37666 type:complete len:555 (-) Transcript_14558:129-1793(-)
MASSERLSRGRHIGSVVGGASPVESPLRQRAPGSRRLVVLSAACVCYVWQSSGGATVARQRGDDGEAFVGAFQLKFLQRTHRVVERGLQGIALQALPTVGKFKSLTKIRVREGADVAATPTGEILDVGEQFEVEEISSPFGADGPNFLRIPGRGWVFDQGIAGSWLGKPIVKQLVGAAAGAGVLDVEATVSSETIAVDAGDALAATRVEMLRMPSNMLGAGFELVMLETKGGKRPLTFLLGAGFPANALTPKGQSILGVTPGEYTGGWFSKSEKTAGKVTLEGVKLRGSSVSLGDIEEVEVLEFPQAALAEQMGVEVHGILGKPFYEKYDLDVDRYAQKLSLFSAGEAAKQTFYSNVKRLVGMSLPSGSLGVAVRGIAPATEDGPSKEVYFVGLVDTGAAHTVMNWEAAKLLGYEGPNDPVFRAATKVVGAGTKGTAEEMPVVQARLALCGVMEGVKPMIKSVSKEQFESTGGNGWYFERLSEGAGLVQLGAVNVAIGDVLGLVALDDSRIGPFTGPAAIIGQDLLFQAKRVIMDVSNKQMWLEPGDVRDDPPL